MTERVRGYPAFGKGARRTRSWWGRAWLQAFEDTTLDQTVVRQGRKWANAGLVGTITAGPGRLAATVADNDDAFHATVSLPVFTDAEWDRFLAQVAVKAGYLAALLDRELPRELVEAADDVGVPLLPGIGDLDPDCTCPGWDTPCRHAAALCHQVAWLLDADPWLVLLVRGRTQDEVVAGARPRIRGVPAAEAFAAVAGELPESPTGPDPVALPDLEPVPGLDVEVLALLVADAAAKARDVLATGEWPSYDDRRDRIRLAATVPELAGRLGADPRAVAAWRQAGPAGLAAFEDAWTPSKAEASRAAGAWHRAELPEAAVTRNRWTVADRQLRHARDGRWFGYVRRDGGWWPAGPPHRDPGTVFADL
ncbi:hypothetical protein GCM10022243_02170 [Saccharothrix violaceirubra]|uniref:Putative Zn finger protein n=1 Tax=Saccharothrix violaceirubra TaxID=413306 RepID=A0A7W7T3L7_9PSEU|nr:SWIM zinc finger family protein [Saccharothrix violaceirubra]MBB4965977.1 putative Zn finger protein [Saccharothrix violaceirubra]